MKDGMALLPDDKFGAADISNGRVVYSHNGDEIGPNEVKDQYVLLAQDKNGRAQAMEIVTHVRIIPVDNQYPVVTVFQAITVDEGGKASMNPSHVEITGMVKFSNNFRFGPDFPCQNFKNFILSCILFLKFLIFIALFCS